MRIALDPSRSVGDPASGRIIWAFQGMSEILSLFYRRELALPPWPFTPSYLKIPPVQMRTYTYDTGTTQARHNAKRLPMPIRACRAKKPFPGNMRTGDSGRADAHLHAQRYLEAYDRTHNVGTKCHGSIGRGPRCIRVHHVKPR
jgi:hypothetical protein